MHDRAHNQAFTLIELAIVLAILGIVAALAATRHGSLLRSARITLAQNEMQRIRDAFLGTSAADGYLDDMSSLPGFSPAYLRLGNLLTATNLYVLGGRRADTDSTNDWSGIHHASPAAFTNWDSALSRGWRGPYILASAGAAPVTAFPAPDDRATPSDPTWAERGFYPSVAHLSLPSDYLSASPYGLPGDPALLDPWAAPYVLQIPPAQAFVTASGALADVPETERFRYARIVSAGPDGVLATPCYNSNTNASGSSWSADQRRASIFAGTSAERGDDLVLFLLRADAYHAAYNHEGDDR